MENPRWIASRLKAGLVSRPEWLILLVFAVLYGPLVHIPLLRTTGDEKVYIAQAWEMAQRGSWFVQTLAETPNYYKAPLHYILVRVGFLVFGPHSLWAGLWMNAVALGLGAFVLTRYLRKAWSHPEAALFCGMGLILAPTVFAHFFASQMEIELLALYTLVLVGLLSWEHETRRRTWWVLWILAGLGSWFKSPLHSVLVGTSLLVAGCLTLHTGVWRRSWFYLAPLGGVVLGGLSVLIPYLLDPDVFYRTYIVRETIAKGPNGISVLKSVAPNLSYHIWPVAPHLALGFLALLGVRRVFRTLFPGLVSALILAIPTFLFFAWHPYRSEIYSLPAIPAVLLSAGILWQHGAVRWPRVALWVQSVSFLSSMLLPAAILLLSWRFPEVRTWWPASLIPLAILGLSIQLLMLLLSLRAEKSPFAAIRPLLLTWTIALAISGQLMAVIGREDMRGLLHLVGQKPERPIGFYNVQHFVWSEWALLNLLSGLPIRGLHDRDSVRHWLLAGGQLIVNSEAEVQSVRGILGSPVPPLQQHCWLRWQSHGTHSSTRNPRHAWRSRDLTSLQGCAYLLSLRNSG